MSAPTLLARALPRASAAGSTSRLTLQHQHPVRLSHIGSQPLILPPATTVTKVPFPPQPDPLSPLPHSWWQAQGIVVKGPLGQQIVPLFPGIEFKEDPRPATPPEGEEPTPTIYRVSITPGWNSKPAVRRQTRKTDPELKLWRPEKVDKGHWGLVRALLGSALTGVTEGHSAILRLVGVGYRAAVESDPDPHLNNVQKAFEEGAKTYFLSQPQRDFYQAQANELNKAKESAQKLILRLGFSEPIVVKLPLGIHATVPSPTSIVLKGISNQQLGDTAAKIRLLRRPEPYKGKGIFLNNETIKLKQVKKK